MERTGSGLIFIAMDHSALHSAGADRAHGDVKLARKGGDTVEAGSQTEEPLDTEMWALRFYD